MNKTPNQTKLDVLRAHWPEDMSMSDYKAEIARLEKAVTGEGNAPRRVYSAGWFYADGDIPTIVSENIPAGKPTLIDDDGRYGYPVYSGGGYSVQMLADVETLERTTKASAPETRTKQAKDLRAGDKIISGGEQFEVRRVHGPTRKDWNHTTVYFRQGKATTVIATTEFKLQEAAQ